MRGEWIGTIALAALLAVLATGAKADPGSLRLAGAGIIGRQLAPDLLAGFAASLRARVPRPRRRR